MTITKNHIEIDGSFGEGGGQILRSSLTLSMLTQKPLYLKNIRSKRPKPGLMRQHLACVLAAQRISNAHVVGAELNSQTLQFEPQAIQAGSYEFAINSAGSSILLFQTVLPALMCAEASSKITFRGGTHNPMAPPYHFIERCFAPLLRRLGVGLELNLTRHGFYPVGGGEFHAEIVPAHANGKTLEPFDLLERGKEVQKPYAQALLTGIPSHVAKRELDILAAVFHWNKEQLQTVSLSQNEGPGNALMVTLSHENVTELFTRFGERKISAEQVAHRLANDVQAYQNSRGALGEYLADQWALPLALAVYQSGKTAQYSCSEISEHTRTNLNIIERFLPLRIEQTGNAETAYRVKIEKT